MREVRLSPGRQGQPRRLSLFRCLPKMRDGRGKTMATNYSAFLLGSAARKQLPGEDRGREDNRRPRRDDEFGRRTGNLRTLSGG